MLKFIAATLAVIALMLIFSQKDNESFNARIKTSEKNSESTFRSIRKSEYTETENTIESDGCLTMDELSKDEHHDDATKWLYDNIIIAYEMPLSIKHLSISDLELQVGNGDIDVMYTLALKYLMSARDLSKAGGLAEGEKPFDHESIDELYKISRHWLWQAALHDKHQALVEIIGTYDIQMHSINNPVKIDAYSIEQNAYKMLLIYVNSDIAGFFDIDNKSITMTEGQNIKTNSLFNELSNKWTADRNKLGKEKGIQLTIPDYLPNYFLKTKKTCSNFN